MKNELLTAIGGVHMNSIRLLVLAGMLGSAASAYAAETAVGQKIFESSCATCHRLQDYAGKTEASLQTTLTAIVAGKIKHKKKLTLSDTEVASIADYIVASQTK
jgi:mono/diheme cytochrome c family protein